MNEPVAIFEFTHNGERFKIFEDGRLVIGPSGFAIDALVIMNRIPLRIKEAELQAIADD